VLAGELPAGLAQHLVAKALEGRVYGGFSSSSIVLPVGHRADAVGPDAVAVPLSGETNVRAART
jgi:hypothetical protein